MLWTSQLFPISELTHTEINTETAMVLFGEPGPLADRQTSLHGSRKIPFLSFFLLLVTQGRVPSAGIGAMATGDEQKPGDCNCAFTRTNRA